MRRLGRAALALAKARLHEYRHCYLKLNGGYSSTSSPAYALTLIFQRMYPPRILCSQLGSCPSTMAASQATIVSSTMTYLKMAEDYHVRKRQNDAYEEEARESVPSLYPLRHNQTNGVVRMFSQ